MTLTQPKTPPLLPGIAELRYSPPSPMESAAKALISGTICVIKTEGYPVAEPASIFEFEDSDAKERALAAAEALPEADDVPAADVRRWLQSWGKPDELPPPPWK